jgi:hypothetical protein
MPQMLPRHCRPRSSSRRHPSHAARSGRAAPLPWWRVAAPPPEASPARNTFWYLFPLPAPAAAATAHRRRHPRRGKRSSDPRDDHLCRAVRVLQSGLSRPDTTGPGGARAVPAPAGPNRIALRAPRLLTARLPLSRPPRRRRQARRPAHGCRADASSSESQAPPGLRLGTGRACAACLTPHRRNWGVCRGCDAGPVPGTVTVTTGWYPGPARLCRAMRAGPEEPRPRAGPGRAPHPAAVEGCGARRTGRCLLSTGRAGSGREGKGQVGSGRAEAGRVGSGQRHHRHRTRRSWLRRTERATLLPLSGDGSTEQRVPSRPARGARGA